MLETQGEVDRPTSVARALKKERGDGDDQAIGRSKGGLSTKIHAMVDTLGNPTGFHLAPGQASDLEGADHLPPVCSAQAVIADKGYDADGRVIEALGKAGKNNRHPAEVEPSPPATTKQPGTFQPPFISQQLSFGLTDDTH